MKLIIAGSRDLNVSNDELFEIIDKFGILYKIKEVVSGGAAGIDSCGEAFAEQYSIKLTLFMADWAKYGGLAGPRRNLEMAQYSDALLLIWNGRSRGSSNIRARMKGMGKAIYEVIKER